jgi:hypothetical protein
MLIGRQHPKAAPIFLCLPCRVKGMPVCLAMLPLAPDIPTARFHEKEIPNFLPTLSSIQLVMQVSQQLNGL